MEYFKPLVVAIWSILVTAKIIYDTRGACFSGADKATDNEKMLVAAAALDPLNWPSKMHLSGQARAETREYWVIALHLFQKFFKKKISEHVNFSLALISNCLSSILIYFVFSNYFDTNTGLVVALIYSTCIWPYQIIFVIGHVHLAQMFFLLAVLSIQSSSAFASPVGMFFYLLGGAFTVCSFVSSSASRKYPPLVFFAFLYSMGPALQYPWEISYYSSANIVLVIIALLLAVLAKSITPVLAAGIRRAAGNSLLHPTPSAGSGTVYDTLGESCLGLLIFLILLITLLADAGAVLKPALAYAAGLSLAAIHVLFPARNIFANTKRYVLWLMGTWRSHFHCYPDPVKTFGRPIPENFRGEGVAWLPPFFWRVIPIPLVLFFCSAGFVAYDVFGSPKFDNAALAFVYFAAIVCISLFPVIVSEITSSLQVGKSYFPSFIGFLFMVAVALNTLSRRLEQNDLMMPAMFATALAIVFLQACVSVRHYFRDVLPARMAATVLRNKLHDLGVSEFFTYDNPYNDSFVKTMAYSYPGEFKINYISSIADVKAGVIVVPGTSSKSESMESQQFSIVHGDFTGDPVLNALYNDKTIEKLALAKVRTRGCSRFFSLETEVVAFRDIILKQISDYDRWIANGWILRAEDVHAEFRKPA